MNIIHWNIIIRTTRRIARYDMIKKDAANKKVEGKFLM